MRKETMDKIYDLSDTALLKGAEEIVNRGNPVSNTQAENLENVCLSLQNTKSIISFANHQIEKNKNKYFYLAVKDYIEKDIKKISEQFSGEDAKKIQYLLAKEFIQHLVSANMYKAYEERRQHNGSRNRQKHFKK